jgi:hypothetical protein
LAVAPTEIRIRLRSGDDQRLTSARINKEDVVVRSDNTVQLPAKTKGTYRIIGRFG